VSDRLDIVRVIDARVTASRRTVARSKQFADAARGDLNTHEEWLERHRQQALEDRERHQRTLRRRQRLQDYKTVAISTVLFLSRLFLTAYRGLAAGFRALDHWVFGGCASIVRGARKSGASLFAALACGIAWTAAQLLAFGLWLAAGLGLGLSLLAKGTLAGGTLAFGASSRGLSWLGSKAMSLNRRLARSLTAGSAAVATKTQNLLSSGSKAMARRLAPRPKSPPDTPRDRDLDQRRLHQASLARLRAEHDWLQARIHALGQRYAKRASGGGHAEPKEWADIRRLALNARRLLEVHDAPMLNAVASGGHRPGQPGEAAGSASANTLPAGRATRRTPSGARMHRRSGP